MLVAWYWWVLLGVMPGIFPFGGGKKFFLFSSPFSLFVETYGSAPTWAPPFCFSMLKGLCLCLISVSCSMRCPGCKGDKSALDGHDLCLQCAGCSAGATCDTCHEWTETAWSAILAFYAEVNPRPPRPKGRKRTAPPAATQTSSSQQPADVTAAIPLPEESVAARATPPRRGDRDSSPEVRYLRTRTRDRPSAPKKPRSSPPRRRRPSPEPRPSSRKSASRRSPRPARSPSPRRSRSPRSPVRTQRSSAPRSVSPRRSPVRPPRQASPSPRRRSPPGSHHASPPAHGRGRAPVRSRVVRVDNSEDEQHYAELWDWQRHPNDGDVPPDMLPIQYRENANRRRRTPPPADQDRNRHADSTPSPAPSSRRRSSSGSSHDSDVDARAFKAREFRKATKVIGKVLPKAKSKSRSSDDVAGPGVDQEDLRRRARPKALSQPPSFRSAVASLNSQLRSSSRGHLFSASSLPRNLNASFRLEWYAPPHQYFRVSKPGPDPDMALFTGNQKGSKKSTEVLDKSSALMRNSLAVSGFLDWATQAISSLAGKKPCKKTNKAIHKIAVVANRAAYQGAVQTMAAAANIDLARRDSVLDSCSLLPDVARDTLRTAPLGGKTLFGHRHVKRLTKKFPNAFAKTQSKPGRGRGRPFSSGRGQQGQHPRPSNQAQHDSGSTNQRRGGGRGRGRGRGRGAKQ